MQAETDSNDHPTPAKYPTSTRDHHSQANIADNTQGYRCESTKNASDEYVTYTAVLTRRAKKLKNQGREHKRTIWVKKNTGTPQENTKVR